MKYKKIISIIFLSAVVFSINVNMISAAELTPIEQLGKFLYFDENLSEPAGQSCASCHHPSFGFADPDKGIPVSEGVIPGLFGGRNSPSAAYAMYSPVRYFDGTTWIGGQFWDSRATGEELGDPLADQALQPFLNGVEMANPDKATVVADVAVSHYADLFEEEWGPDAFADVEEAYDNIAKSIAAFERTREFGQFSSKYDFYLKTCIAEEGDPAECAAGVGGIADSVGKKIFSKKEWNGFQLFMGDNDNDGELTHQEGAKCSACHVVDWTDDPGNVQIPAWAPTDSDGNQMVPPMFTDFTYDNLGVPKSDHKLLINNPVDEGLGPVVDDPNENGKFKVMTLRNIHQTAPYAHNGLFKKLEEIVHFYNTRDVAAEGWSPPESPETVNTGELGNLGLSENDEDDLVKFMKTLTDGWEGWMQ